MEVNALWAQIDQWKTGDRRVNVLSVPPSTESSKAQFCLVSGDNWCDWASASNKWPAVPPYGSCQRITQHINPSLGILSLLMSLSLTLTALGLHLSRRILAPYPWLRFPVPQKTWPKTGPIEKIPILRTHSGPLRICHCISIPKVEFVFLVPSLSKCQTVCDLDPSPLNWLWFVSILLKCGAEDGMSHMIESFSLERSISWGNFFVCFRKKIISKWKWN